MGRNYSDLREYLNKECYDDLHSAVLKCVKSYHVYLGSNYIEHPFEYEIEDVSVTSLWSEIPNPNDNCEVIIHATVNADFTITGYVYIDHHKEQDTDSSNRYFSVILKADINDCLIIKSALACPIDEKERFNVNSSGTKSFIPYLKEENMDAKASEILSRFYPEALITPIALDVNRLALNIGLKVLHTVLPDGIFGQMLFSNKTDALTGTIIPSKTILVDDTKSSFNAVMDARCTVVHESLHWILHQNFFKLLHLLNNSLSGIECSSVEEDIESPKKHSDEFKWMEWQANSLTPRILMPAKMVEVAVKKFDNNNFYEILTPTIARDLINYVARIFNVSKTMAKIRLLQLGHTELKGINEYSDEVQTPGYLFSKDTINDSQTFTADRRDSLVSMFFSSEIKDLLIKGKIVFVDGLFVINDKKYVFHNNSSRKYQLTDYALLHIEECAFAFDIEKKFKTCVDDRFYSMCFACRTGNNSSHLNKILNVSNEQNEYIINKARELQDTVEDIEFLRSLPEDDFNECLKQILEHIYGTSYSFSELKRLTRLDNTTITDYVFNGAKPKSLKSVLALISGLYIQPMIAHKLLGALDYDIKNKLTQDNIIYCWLISNMPGCGADAWNQVLLQLKMPNLLVPDSAKPSLYE